MKIFINPGHGPQLDPGACGNGLREADVVLKIGQHVENYLRAVGYDVKLFHRAERKAHGLRHVSKINW